MNDPTPESESSGTPCGSDSLDCVNLIFDLVPDTTVRPLRPALLKLALAERERLARWQAQANQAPPAGDPPSGPDPQNGAG